MDVVKLYTNPDGSIKAAHIVDGSESYPVLIEALGNTIILPELIAGGWSLMELPLALAKNGTPLESLPKAEWTSALEAQYGQDMYDMLGTPMPMDERRKFLYRGTKVTAFATMPSYKYNTREEFLSYLQSIRAGVPDEDYLPLNCLVAPNARFTIEEFIMPDNRTNVAAIASRRNMSFTRYTKLVAFLKQNGLGETFTAKDFLLTYHKWGIDGVQFATIGNPTVEKVNIVEGAYAMGDGDLQMGLMPATSQVYALLTKKADGGFDVICPPGVKPNDLYGPSQIKPYNAFTDEEERRKHRFELDSLESARAQTLQAGEAMAIRRHIRKPTYRLELNVANNPSVDVIKATFARISFGPTFSTPGFSFSTSANTPMSLDCVGNPEEARRSAYMMAIANDVIGRRKTQSNRTLISALQENGFSTISALAYALTSNGMGIPDQPTAPDDEGISVPAMSRDTLVEYVRAKANPDIERETLDALPLVDTYDMEPADARQSAIDTLDGFMDGTSGDPALLQAIANEEKETPDSYYEVFRALQSCTSITDDQIYDQVAKWKPGQPIVITTPEGIKVTLNGSILKGVENAYGRLKNTIRLNQAKKAYYYVWVDGAIRALGDPDRDQHSGFFATVLDMRKPRVQEARETFANYYVDRVIADIAPLKETDYARWNSLMTAFVGNPTSSQNLDYGQVPRMYFTEGIAVYVAASMLMQFIKTGVARLPLPSGDVNISAKDAPELAALAESMKKYLLNGRVSYVCYCQSFCDFVVSTIPGDMSWYFYPVNAIITPDKVLPRPGCRIMEYDGVFSYNYTTFVGIYENAGTPERMPHVAQRAFLSANELQKRGSDTDLIYALISGEVTGYESYLQSYYREALQVATEWKNSSPQEHLDAVTGPWEARWSINGVAPISSGRAEPDQNGTPCFRPYNGLKVLEPVKPVVTETASVIKVFTGITASEYRNGVGEFLPPARRGRAGFFAVDGDFITLYSMDPNAEPRVINACDIATLNPEDYPVKHIYGNRWVIRDGAGTLYSVEV